MSNAVDSVVSTALALQSSKIAQETANVLLRKSLDNQASIVTNLLEAAVTGPQKSAHLANYGLVGRNVDTTA